MSFSIQTCVLVRKVNDMKWGKETPRFSQLPSLLQIIITINSFMNKLFAIIDWLININIDQLFFLLRILSILTHTQRLLLKLYYLHNQKIKIQNIYTRIKILLYNMIIKLKLISWLK